MQIISTLLGTLLDMYYASRRAYCFLTHNPQGAWVRVPGRVHVERVEDGVMAKDIRYTCNICDCEHTIRITWKCDTLAWAGSETMTWEGVVVEGGVNLVDTSNKR